MDCPAHIILIGRFPPPPDGQSVATQRLADHLDARSTVHRINTMIPADASLVAKWSHYRAAGKALKEALEHYPDALVIWTSISPETAGHFRDALTIFPHLAGQQVIAVVHWGKFATVFENAATRWSARRLLPSLDRIVFTADLLSEACRSWLPDAQRSVISNTLTKALIPDDAAVENRIGKGPGSPVRVLFLSNMIREKGWEDVLKAASTLDKEDFPAEWVFAGGWPDPTQKERFDRVVMDLGLESNVHHRGLITNQEQLAKEHLEADIFVLPSWLREAQPLSIMEAMAAGTPCIVADDGGMPDMIGTNANQAAGLVISAKQPAQIADALRTLSEPVAWEKAARNARHRFEAHYSPERVNRQWDELIDSVVSAGGES